MKFDIDPTLVRLDFVALSLLAGGGLAVYIIAAIIMPDAPVPEVYTSDKQ